MPTKTRASIVAGTVLSVLILLVWGVLLATISDLDASDAMGNALAKGLAEMEIILLWILLGALLLVAALRGAMPRPVALAALVLLIASAFASTSAVELLADRSTPPFLWPILTPMLAPPIVVAFCFWTLLPSARAMVPFGAAAATALGALFVLTALMVPMQHIRERAVQREAVQREDWARDFEVLPDDAPLWDITPFLNTGDNTRVQAVLDRIRHLDRRQADAENMLDRGDFPLTWLGAFDLEPTPSICAKARSLLLRRVQPLIPRKPDAAPYLVVANDVAGAVAAMAWLVGYGCSSDAESEAWEAMANAYRNPNFDVVRLRELRDPRELGRTLREHPAHFSMLTPQAHLKAWLTFADDNDFREPALAGARTLEHRTSDAVDMLRASEFDAYRLLMYLPELDLETTPALCNAVLKALHDQFARIYRPPADDPRPYQELLERLGIGSPLIALQWVAAHGCNADDELTEAETLVRSYQDSPVRAAMLTRLAELHRN
jgi:hypothetical protein